MAYEWIEPVIDRTYADIKKANYLNNKKISFLKGCLNYTDLNRIENNIALIAWKLGLPDKFKQWSINDIPTKSDRIRLLQSLKECYDIVGNYYSIELSIDVPEKLSDYNDFNQLENVTLKLYEIGEENGWPSSYKDKYHFSVYPETEHETLFSFDENIIILEGKDVLPNDRPWNSSNVYAGYAGQDGLCGSGYSTIEMYPPIEPDCFNVYISKSPAVAEKVNIRPFLRMHNSGSQPIPHYFFRWTNIDEFFPLGEAVTALDPYRQGEKNASYNPVGIYGLAQLYPMAAFPINSIIIRVMFTIEKYTLKSGKEPTSVNREFYQIKPADQTPQGAYYDERLWNEGYYTEESDGNTVLTCCTGMFVNFYAGKVGFAYDSQKDSYPDAVSTRARKKVTNVNVDSDTCGTDRIIPETFAPGSTSSKKDYVADMVLMAETVADGSVFYSALPGIRFDDGTREDTVTISANLNADRYYFSMATVPSPNYFGSSLRHIVRTKANNRAWVIPDYVGSGNLGLGEDEYLELPNDKAWHMFSGDVISRYYRHGTGTNPEIRLTPIYRIVYPIKDLVKTLAATGIAWADNLTTAQYAKLGNEIDSPHVYRGNIAPDGTTDGTYAQGTACNAQPQGLWKDALRDNNYSPVVPESEV